LRVGEDEATLTISDSGMTGAVPTVGQGVGRTLMTAFARQLRGDVVFAANDDGGLTARLTFPARPPGADRKIVEEQTGK